MPDEMHPDLAALLQRLQALEERQDRLEAKLQDRQAEILEPQPPASSSCDLEVVHSLVKADKEGQSSLPARRYSSFPLVN